MVHPIYKQLLDVMKGRGGPFAALDIPEFYHMVTEIFTIEEAEMNNVLTRKPTTAEDISKKISKDKSSVIQLLEQMAEKGLCHAFTQNGVRFYQGLPFMPGILEYQFLSGKETERERKLAILIHQYQKAYQSAKGIESPTYPVTRVIPIHKTIHVKNVIHTYDQVSTYIQKYDAIGVGTCYCRQSAKLRGEDIHGMPLDVCMWFGNIAEYVIEKLGTRRVSKQEAMDILNRSEEAGLVHMTRNTTQDIDYLCNCDRWHCEVITHVMKYPTPGKFFNSGFQPVFNKELCAACETCIDRCPPYALTMSDQNVPTVNLDLCFGCGVCASGCPQNAIVMEPKPNFPEPPKDTKELVARLKKA